MSESPEQRVVILGPGGAPVGESMGGPGAAEGVSPTPTEQDGSAGMVEEPAKVMRIGTMVRQLLEEVRSAPLDEASRARMREIYSTSIRELEEGLSPELRDELRRLHLPFTEDSVPSDAELRVAQAQLVGWLEGLFHGIQTALFAQQVVARAQVEGRRALPGLPGGDGPAARPTGQYL